MRLPDAGFRFSPWCVWTIRVRKSAVKLLRLALHIRQQDTCIGIACHVTRHTSRVTSHTSRVTRHTSHVTRHASQVTRHTSHVTRHTSHVTRHTSLVTRHTSSTLQKNLKSRVIVSPHFALDTTGIDHSSLSAAAAAAAASTSASASSYLQFCLLFVTYSFHLNCNHIISFNSNTITSEFHSDIASSLSLICDVSPSICISKFSNSFVVKPKLTFHICYIVYKMNWL